MKTLKQTYTINSPVAKVWKALVDPKIINKWGAGPAKMDDKVGTKFTLWKSEIFGTNTEVVKKKKLVQDWWSGADRWDEASKVTFTLTEKNGKTKLDLLHEKVPNRSAKEIDDGWKEFYLGPLKKYLEGK